MQLRFIERDGKKILQQFIVSEIPFSGWVDVPLVKQEYDKPKEYWLVAGRYFESEHDARMWKNTNGSAHKYSEGKVIHVKEVEE